MLTIVNCETDQTEINNLNQRIDALTIANNNLRAQISTLTGTTTTITGGNTTIIMNLQNQLNALSGASAEQIRTLQNQLSTLSGANAEQIMTLQNDINYLNRHNFTYEFVLADENDNSQDIWSDGNTMWVLNPDTNGKIFAYNMTTISGAKQRLPNREITLSGEDDIVTYGIFADANTIWTVTIPRDYSDFSAYDLSTRTRNTIRDFRGSSFQGFSQVYSDGTSVYGLANAGGTNIVSIGAINIPREINRPEVIRDVRIEINNTILVASGNILPTGLWSDGETMWVADEGNDKIYAYNLQTKAREEGKDFNTLIGAGNRTPRGIWSDGRTMWVLDNVNNRIYAYDMVTKERLGFD